MSTKIKNLRNELIYQTPLLSYADGGGPVSYCTAKNYKANIGHFVDYCRAGGYKHLADIKGHETAVLQGFADSLAAAKSASTIHTYLAPACKALGIGLGAVSKPIRTAANFEKSSSAPDPRTMNRVQALAAATGIRQAEMGRLRGGDMYTTAAGEMYVNVRRGKGGKSQQQRILPQHEAAVAAAFGGVAPGAYLFDKGEAAATSGTHALRRQVAAEAYQYYVQQGSTPAGRRAIYDGIAARWHRDNRGGKPLEGKEWFDHSPYVLRGDNRAAAIASGVPVSYDRLALRALSVHCLSHWRDNVTISNYLLGRGDGDDD